MISSTQKDINNAAYDFLKQSKSFDVFPTPVDKIIEYCELNIDKNGIHKINKNYFSKKKDILERALRKVFGIFDRKEKIIYIQPSLHPSKKNFVKLHEVGHHALSWQREICEFIDDEQTLSPNTKEQFEIEANYFASATLFQLDRFEEHIAKLPLEINSPLHLSQKFGSSFHSAARRYVQYSHKKCSLLILQNCKSKEADLQLKFHSYFQSDHFYKSFGRLTWPDILGMEWCFVQDYKIGKKHHQDGEISLITPNGLVDFCYHFFDNSFNVFVFLMPIGEKIRTKTKIYLKGVDV